MAKTGRVYENMMINLAPSNIKLEKRVVRITAAILDCSEDEARKCLEKNGWNIRCAVEAQKK
jgi:N-acetylmuramic acid 6-phosphate etherase